MNNGSIWGWAICVIIVAEVGKFLPCAVSAYFTGKTLREAGAIGSLMACKGLVELIVLNIGLTAGILNPPVFAMFVLMALLVRGSALTELWATVPETEGGGDCAQTTFATTPLTLAFYPVSYRERRAKEDLAARSAAVGLDEKQDGQDGGHAQDDGAQSRYLVVLNRLEHLPSMMVGFARSISATRAAPVAELVLQIHRHSSSSSSRPCSTRAAPRRRPTATRLTPRKTRRSGRRRPTSATTAVLGRASRSTRSG